ncbi:protein of unknown function DUF214 [Pirellula staleyi DSM 6068]|uniref:ABC3 transporter permease protein domain-containing protein n=1 Tax=Pirellula staleyi (strain ATCC 27377 / DSM 6068 / ICPB 4128) TaxID=530564 RepID=D2R979_PIRSD|nr:ABC transporter permease [Pirellula staleyi]ADB17629.1 protein of unknown function DUF214 [Pirellula staleyi DSM 6068]
MPFDLLLAAETTPFEISLDSLEPLLVGVAIIVLLMVIGKVPVTYNIRNLSVRWVSTALTGLAFTMVIGTLTVMLAFVNGMVKLAEGSGQPGNVLIFSEGSTDETFSNLGFSDVGEIELVDGILRDEENKPMVSRETFLVVNQPVVVQQANRPARRFLQVRGVEDSRMAGRVHGMQLIAGGEWITREGVRTLADGKTNAIQAILGEGVATTLGRDRKPEDLAKAKDPTQLVAGDLFSLGGRDWIVMGVFKSSGSTFDSEIWAKRDIVGPMFGKNTYTSLVLRTAGAPEAQKLQKYFNEEYTRASVKAYQESEYYKSLAQTTKQFLYAIIVITAIMSIGGICGVMNTMFAAVANRMRDIGVLRILGYSRMDVQMSFLLESLVLALVGGASGCLMGCLAHGLKASSIVSSGPGGGKFVVLELVVSGDVIAVGLTATLVMGLLGGILPSIRAMFIRPLESLR